MSTEASKSGTVHLAGEAAYTTKPETYFSGARVDFVNDLPNNKDAEILEIGCGRGGTGRLALAQAKCARYRAVELDAESAAVAGEYLTEVIHGDVERMELPWPKSTFDALILSEVLEHLTDPWAVLRKLHTVLKPGAIAIAGSPNVAHYRVILMLLRGDWQLTDSGTMDRTHLRWFTPKTYQRLFEASGFEILSTSGVGNDGLKAKLASALLFNHYSWIWARQIKLTARRI